jgi:hypothetical protein
MHIWSHLQAFVILATGLEGLESFELIRESLGSFGSCWARGLKAA